jgi:lipopolysaccharide transport system ATP-binding protein
LNAGVLGQLDGQEQFLGRQIDIGMFRVIPNPERLSTGLVDMVAPPDLQFVLAKVAGAKNA